MNFCIPEEKKVRVIMNADTKNEVDDQYAIVHGLLTQSFDLLGIIPTHFGQNKSKTSQQDSYEETMLLLKKMNMVGKVRIENGGTHSLVDENTPVASEGAQLIIEEGMKEDDRPLYIAFLGPLTDMASALLMEPKLNEKNIIVIWIGGGNWPAGGREYNLSNDIIAARLIFKSNIQVWQVPRNVYRMMPVTYAELAEKVRPQGEIGRYLVDNLIDFNNASVKRPTEYRVLGDSPGIGLILYEDCGSWTMENAPDFKDDMSYIHGVNSHKIRVYQNIDSRFILEDFYAKLRQFNEGENI